MEQVSSSDDSQEARDEDVDKYIESMGIFGDPTVCTYEEGAQDQFVFVCEECTATSGRIVAVCVGCAVRCHSQCTPAGPALLEVGAKKAIRCDCSTACAFNTGQEERPPNANVYEPRHNFEGRFCWCDRRFEAEEGQPAPSLSQCYVCTDWFHLSCVGLSEDAEEGCLVCRDCVRHVQRYLPRLEVGSADRPAAPPASCPELLPLSPSVDPRAARSVLLVPNFRPLLCQCADCQAKFDTLLLNDQAGAEVSTRELFQAAMKGLPHDQQIELAHMGAKIHSAIEEAKAVRSASKRGPLDESDVEAIFEMVAGKIENFQNLKRHKGGD